MTRLLKSYRSVRLSLVREQAPAPYLGDSRGVVQLVAGLLQDRTTECVLAIYLDTRHRVIAVHECSSGGVASSVVEPRAVFGAALSLSASALLLAHNHPSGDPTPSGDDKMVTKRIRDAGELLGIALLDHVVIGSRRYYSFATEAFEVTPWNRPIYLQEGS